MNNDTKVTLGYGRSYVKVEGDGAVLLTLLIGAVLIAGAAKALKA
jgi:hypothetical protein